MERDRSSDTWTQSAVAGGTLYTLPRRVATGEHKRETTDSKASITVSIVTLRIGVMATRLKGTIIEMFNAIVAAYGEAYEQIDEDARALQIFDFSTIFNSFEIEETTSQNEMTKCDQ